jgi:hypothetical protein
MRFCSTVVVICSIVELVSSSAAASSLLRWDIPWVAWRSCAEVSATSVATRRTASTPLWTRSTVKTA